MKRVIKISVDGEKVVVSKEEITRILFHRGRMLLLDQVTIYNDRAFGEFTVPPENCEGHSPQPNMPVMRGVDIIEMAFQLLGILIAKNHKLSELVKEKTLVAREVSDAKFNGLVLPGDELTLEIATDINVDYCPGETYRIESGRIIARVEGKKKATIASVVIVAF